jgi:UPF0755 protein
VSDLFMDEVIRPGEPSDDDGRARRGGREQRERERRRRRRRGGIAVVVAFALLAGSVVVVWQLARPLLSGMGTSTAQEEAADFPGPGFGSVDVTIPAGATGGDMARELHAAGVVASTRAFTQAFAANPDASGIQPGTYRLMQEMSATGAVSALLDSSNRVQVRATIPEGFRVTQILERLSSVTGVSVEEFEAVLENPEATGLPAEAGGNHEGWLFPATYTFEPSTTPEQMIAQMVTQMVRVLDERGVPAEQRQDILIKASLIERESPNAEASPKMARAIFNRIDRGMPLQIDAAVAYGLNKPGTELTLDDISADATDNPYNTYAHGGLTPTPIASPGLDSIDAVLNPADGPWLFWATINLDTGETLFAETYAEHQQNVQKLREWQAQNQ